MGKRRRKGREGEKEGECLVCFPWHPFSHISHILYMQATARLTATVDGRLLREATVERVAFELGAGLLCNGTCSGASGETGVRDMATA